MKDDIFFIERNIHGTWVIYGAIGVQQYYGYTKKVAQAKYRQKCRETLVYEERKDDSEYQKHMS